ncbi:hypothetical protein NC652_001882 [Populus alba x Populus x berolinensis]|uniref:Uncharacterized protein n=1 Tax=Populus alba x Populus x berolinensis TaxID=444605 RepID=A0AAD6RMD6_9ROSI|nr:hypothetical protein NC652_001882 [Populus alba x Populus x berolinensis]KAJ7011669.1 hypothetical protein NC653_001935 [Populus alba x Populus x berolinensis]KAJ7011683.1 hypothetical protein NC653_001941 [Populus alba x Populus x berolinensis]
MADPYTLGHITYANIVASTFAQSQIEKITEQIHLLSKKVIRLRGKMPTHSQPAHYVPTHILPPQPQKTHVAQRCISYVEEYG